MTAAELTVNVALTSTAPVLVRVTIYHDWARPAQRREIFLLPRCLPGVTEVIVVRKGP